MKKIFFIILLVVFAAAGAVACAAKISKPKISVFYVSPRGNNADSGSIAKPWKTIQFAADRLIAGDTLYIRKGIYKERVLPKNSGATGKFITYVAYPGEEAVIDGAGITLPADQAGLLEVNGKSYIKISGLKIKNAKGDDESNGIFVKQSEHIILEKNYTYNTRSSGIGVWDNSKDITIDGNEVVNANMGPMQESISISGTDGFVIKNNKVHDTVADKEGICVKEGSRNGQIYKNLVYNVPAAGIYIDAWNQPTFNIGVYQNIVRDTTSSAKGNGIAVASEMGGELSDIKINNNIVYGTRAYGILVSHNGDESVAHHPLRNIKVFNNTVYKNGEGWGGGIAVNNPDAQNVEIRNNIVSQNLSFQISVDPGIAVVVDHNLIDGYRGDTGDNEIRGTDYIEGDPLFINTGNANFYLRKNSPAIDKGIADGAPPVDFDGRARPQGAGYDLGAFEYAN